MCPGGWLKRSYCGTIFLDTTHRCTNQGKAGNFFDNQGATSSSNYLNHVGHCRDSLRCRVSPYAQHRVGAGQWAGCTYHSATRRGQYYPFHRPLSQRNRAAALRTLHERKADVRRLIDAQGKLTAELAASIAAAATLQEVEDLYLPYRPKRKTRASIAREKGLAPLAELILQQPELRGDASAILEQHAQPFLDAEKGIDTSLEAYAGARDIAAEIIAEDANVRGSVRATYFKRSTIAARPVDPEKIAEKDPNGLYQLYYDFNESVTKLVPHRVLALNRAEREEVLRVSVSLDYMQAEPDIARHHLVKATSPFAGQLSAAMEDGYKRLLAPAMEREVRAELTRQAEEHAINIFAANLRNLLLQPPLRGRKVDIT